MNLSSAENMSNINFQNLSNRMQEPSPSDDIQNLISAATYMVPRTIQELQIHYVDAANLLPLCNSDRVSMLHHGMISGTFVNNHLENGVFPEICTSNVSLLNPEQENQIDANGFTPISSAFSVPQASSQLSFSCDNAHVFSYTNGRHNASLFSTTITEKLQYAMVKQKEEIDQFIDVQMEQVKELLEERIITNLIPAFEEASKILNDKEVELEKANRRNLELEEFVQQLFLEGQVWRNMAKHNEILASNLRASLEQVAQNSEFVESSQPREAANSYAWIFQENKELKDQRTCRVCRGENVCVLLLPCRHVCLCRHCEKQLDACPICESAKSASVWVNMA